MTGIHINNACAVLTIGYKRDKTTASVRRGAVSADTYRPVIHDGADAAAFRRTRNETSTEQAAFWVRLFFCHRTAARSRRDPAACTKKAADYLTHCIKCVTMKVNESQGIR